MSWLTAARALLRRRGRPSRPVHHVDRGNAAEELVARVLTDRGYRVLLRNVRTRAGEIDIVAEQEGTIVFVEVKARRPGGRKGTAYDALTPAKLRRVAGAADRLLSERGLLGAPRRFLGAAVRLDHDGRPHDVRLVPIPEIR